MDKRIKGKQLSTAITSAALQDHLLRNCNLGLIDFKKKEPRRKTLQKLSSIKKVQEIKKLQNEEKNSILPYENTKIKKLKQAVEEEEKFNQYNKKLTLAQRLGLIDPPPPPLSNKQWEAIQQKSKNRNDSENVCSICLENFKIQPQVILSCTHLFHSVCLNSYEKHNRVRCCPICRKRDYQKKIIDEGIRLFTLKSILRIQRVFRGSRTRIKIYSDLVDSSYNATSKLWKRRLIGFKMWRLSRKISDKVKKDNIKYTEMIKKLQIKHNKDKEQIIQQMIQVQRNKIQNQGDIQKYLKVLGIQPSKKHISNINWEEVKQKGISRIENQCAICLMSLWNKPVYLLSCTHLFHVNCIEGLQRYALYGNKNQCPCCRANYQKKIVEHKHNNL